MNNIKPVKISNSTDNLFKIFACLFLVNFCILDDVVEELAILDILHNQKQMPTSLDNFVELYDRRMPDKFQNMNLTWDSLHVGDIDDFLFNKNFNSNSLAC